jgi:hypothetical protein
MFLFKRDWTQKFSILLIFKKIFWDFFSKSKSKKIFSKQRVKFFKHFSFLLLFLYFLIYSLFRVAFSNQTLFTFIQKMVILLFIIHIITAIVLLLVTATYLIEFSYRHQNYTKIKRQLQVFLKQLIKNIKI